MVTTVDPATRPYRGLLVLMMMFNSTDLKNSDDSIYEYRDRGVERRHVVRVLGAALGGTNRLAPRASQGACPGVRHVRIPNP